MAAGKDRLQVRKGTNRADRVHVKGGWEEKVVGRQVAAAEN